MLEGRFGAMLTFALMLMGRITILTSMGAIATSVGGVGISLPGINSRCPRVEISTAAPRGCKREALSPMRFFPLQSGAILPRQLILARHFPPV